ncbi:MAG: type II toxin-antitoxin system RelE/ParE family toxin [Leptospirales bacterium]
MKYFFHPAAEAEHLEIIAYYESKKPGLGASYLEDFELGAASICDMPNLFPVDKQPDIRRMNLIKFPFTVIYREFSRSIQVLAIAHQRRRPQYWLGRF